MLRCMTLTLPNFPYLCLLHTLIDPVSGDIHIRLDYPGDPVSWVQKYHVKTALCMYITNKGYSVHVNIVYTVRSVLPVLLFLIVKVWFLLKFCGMYKLLLLLLMSGHVWTSTKLPLVNKDLKVEYLKPSDPGPVFEQREVDISLQLSVRLFYTN